MSAPLPPLAAIPADVVAACDYARRVGQHLDANALAYLQGGAGDEETLHENGNAFADFRLWPRPLAAVSDGHTRCCLFGRELQHPLLLAPVAYQKLFHADGELATALAAGALETPFVVSTLATTRLEEIAARAAGPLWFQLYWQGGRAASLHLLRRAEAAGCQALVFTVDAALAGIRNREQRAGFRLPPGLSTVNLENVPKPASTVNAAVSAGSPVFAALAGAPNWDDVAWLREQTRLPLLLKGILHPDDALKARSLGVDGLVVSNHGGRVLDRVPASLHALPEIRAALGAGYPLLLDGGIRRGSDVFTALALGADAVLIGRPYIEALAVVGPLGVAHLLRLLREELEVCMALCGCPTLAAIGPACLQPA